MLAPQHSSFESAMRFLGKFLHIEAIHHTVDGDQHMRLLIIRVDALADSDEPDAGEVQLLEEGKGVLCISACSAESVGRRR